jgi:hypothetical protein
LDNSDILFIKKNFMLHVRERKVFCPWGMKVLTFCSLFYVGYEELTLTKICAANFLVQSVKLLGLHIHSYSLSILLFHFIIFQTTNTTLHLQFYMFYLRVSHSKMSEACTFGQRRSVCKSLYEPIQWHPIHRISLP